MSPPPTANDRGGGGGGFHRQRGCGSVQEEKACLIATAAQLSTMRFQRAYYSAVFVKGAAGG